MTVATTNNPSAIDAAARRLCRFGRASIVERYLAPLGANVDAGVVALATEGFTGADLAS